jgi:AAA ATPase domain
MGTGNLTQLANGGSGLVGREAEQALIAARLGHPDEGAAILVRGPAGIGKSALVDDAVQRAAASTRILWTVGASSETGLAMAGLYQLLEPLLPLAHLIPEPRQAALRPTPPCTATGSRPPVRWSVS